MWNGQNERWNEGLWLHVKLLWYSLGQHRYTRTACLLYLWKRVYNSPLQYSNLAQQAAMTARSSHTITTYWYWPCGFSIPLLLLWSHHSAVTIIIVTIFIAIFWSIISYPVHAGGVYMCVALLQCKHHRFTATLLKLQHASLHATNDVKWSLWLPDPGWAASLWTRQLPLKSYRRWSRAIFYDVIITGFVAFSLVYFHEFEGKLRRAKIFFP